MTKSIFRIENRRQAESNQACLNCRGAKEEKSANALLAMVKTVAILAAVTMFAACEPEEKNNPIDPGTEQDADFVAFTFEGIDGAAVIDRDEHTVSAKAKETGDLANITAEFTLSTGATATVDDTPQVSKTTANDFNNPVIYEVTSGDGETTLDWTVTITKEGNTGDCETELTREMIANGGTLPKCTYIVKSSIIVFTQNPLTILPGTVFKFEKREEGSYTISTSGNIIAIGTAEEPIIFTSAETTPQAGDWGDVAAASGSHFEHCIFEYGAKNDVPSPGATAMLIIKPGGNQQPTVKNCTFRHSELGGMTTQAKAGFAQFDYNTFTDCGETIPLLDGELSGNAFPLSAATMEHITGIGKNNVFNTAKGIGVEELDISLESKNFTLKNPGTLYYLFSSILVDLGCKLTIEAGTHIVMSNSNTFISIDRRDSPVFTAVGTADNPIIFSSISNQRDFWDGISIDAYNCEVNMAYCIISGVGALSTGTSRAISVYWGNEKVSITNCLVRNCASDGIWVNKNTYEQKMTLAGNTCEDIDGECTVYID